MSELKRVAMWVGVPLAVLGGVQIVTAAAQVKTWTSGDTLTAADLNANFQAMNDAFVGKSGDETIDGNKTFAKSIVAPPNHASAEVTTSFSTSSLTFVPVTNLSATITTHGNPVLVTVTTNFNATATPGTGLTAWGVATIVRDTTNLGHPSYGFQIAEDDLGKNDPMSFTFVDKPAAGAHTYAVHVHVGAAGMTADFGEGGQTQQISVTELN